MAGRRGTEKSKKPLYGKYHPRKIVMKYTEELFQWALSEEEKGTLPSRKLEGRMEALNRIKVKVGTMLTFW